MHRETYQSVGRQFEVAYAGSDVLEEMQRYHGRVDRYYTATRNPDIPEF
jgi:hypothetical protein